jgi:two-component system osmolarity sensor histidine kinase EnvZ
VPVQAAQQIASLVNLSREALRHADGINRVALVKSDGRAEAIRVAPREPGDRGSPSRPTASPAAWRASCDRASAPTPSWPQRQRQPGLWVGFTIERDAYWLQAEAARIQPLTRGTWFVWSASRCWPR